MMMNFAFEYCK